ncbi:hypothetical protein NPIL_602191 [Nephila pilipes]|uniref:Uncharacterized protein n=1 Tax=Nephila pilipes TaxID=299642 RepID=A0A8X6NGZ0_NEPPI|nr:hypothetical protein NPIL_602191 [Nephila pilipes]
MSSSFRHPPPSPPPPHQTSRIGVPAERARVANAHVPHLSLEMENMSTYGFLGSVHRLWANGTIVQNFKDCVKPLVPVNGIQSRLRQFDPEGIVWHPRTSQDVRSSRYNFGFSYSVQMACKRSPCPILAASSMSSFSNSAGSK